MKQNKTNKTYFGLNFIATGNETGGKYFVSKTIIPSGDGGPPPHIHSNEDESFFLTKGQLEFIIGGQNIQLNQGEFLNIEKGEKHYWRNASNVDAELIIIFSPAGIEDMFIELENDLARIKEIGAKYGTEFDIY